MSTLNVDNPALEKEQVQAGIKLATKLIYLTFPYTISPKNQPFLFKGGDNKTAFQGGFVVESVF
ncbi:MAG: hypothetical protein A3G51_03900 [Candidatus Yanofskybacteria bacterium RIFCSPLOWO2_12_FULL_43_11b]|uniref:Uncharacterized protein n=1 Tax=Candidatus Yanofskybacteria bacterium RIFCSPLOWO2_12_FULL_43_11b TaxID=1802710 RepID=A0A1F8H899_9BACT|nr:MAG: hypothetical protein A2742_03445 [Candidatus Yanofskybacteria bacterium RIFCSPHIGHO2_01_FULL_43_32]OGN18256.1 MAG: hypothetical protein A3E34_02505 [Candidatus Yanofskybacteria bacterium RIFCSPHIGHO2_12_FULL_43_11]OGN25217.1 MAG: hypothetical protein A2923_00570 [Candidatus Yanofskybacteria bacterium RIFCSPLOWO2_01_FULL_43_46]OGN33764.1 MAG: hypothetical protein A3G51_03900 [Candidatus Yanofskybacteria bacterium RIFCSPLOWO2_12_FULL_43_11b]